MRRIFETGIRGLRRVIETVRGLSNKGSFLRLSMTATVLIPEYCAI